MDGFTAFDMTDAGWLFKSMCMQNGCPIVEVEDGVITPVFNSDEALEVATYWKKLVDSGIMAAGEHTAAENKFLAGNLAFLAMSSNRISRWTDVDINIGAIEMPYFKRSPSRSAATCSSSSAGRAEDRSRMGPRQLPALAGAEPRLCAEHRLSARPPIRGDVRRGNRGNCTDEMYAVAFKQLSYAWAYVHFEQMGTMDLQIADALSRIEKGTREPEEALDKAQEKLVSEMEFDAQ